ncbi:MAG: helix-turn-helix domain-containing protein [Burkholderiaceae bacterium]|nr:helix-turn-helix domain-containing protein [Burkholderiaceae bacterium]
MRSRRQEISLARNSRRFVVPSKTKPLTEAQLAAYEAGRDIGSDLLQAIREMKAGQGRVVYSAAIEARKRTGLSQSQFATLLGVSVRTLQGWEQGRKQPSGAARTLLAIARTNPKAVLAVVEKDPA